MEFYQNVPFYNARTISSKPTGASEERACSWIDVTLPNKRTVRIAVTHLDVSTDQVRISMLSIINSNILANNNLPTLLWVILMHYQVQKP